jgi:hypothetical protein
MAWTNLGKEKMFESFFCSGAVEDGFRLILAGASPPLTADTLSTSAITLVSSVITEGGGGTSGIRVSKDENDDGFNFDVSGSAVLGADAARAVLQTSSSDFEFTGEITDARYVVLVGHDSSDKAGGFEFKGNNIYAWWDLGQTVSIPSGSLLNIRNLSLQGQ